MVLRKTGGWIELEVPTVAVIIGGVVRSEIEGARGAAPADELLGDSLISFLGTSVYCGFCQSACAMVLPPIWAAVAGAGDPCWWGFLELSMHRGLWT